MNLTGTVRPAALILGLAAALGLAACGSAAKTSAGSTAATPGVATSSAATSSAPGAAPAAAGSLTPAAALAAAYKGQTGLPPTSSPKPPTGKNIWIVSCGQSQSACSTPSAGASAAATALGWKNTVCDGKLSPPGWQACVRQGVSSKVDAIVAIGLDCPTIQAALMEAKAAKIPTIDVGGNDCSAFGSPDEFTVNEQKLPNQSSEQFWNLMGSLEADYVIGKTDGKATVLSAKFTDGLFGTWIQDGFTKELSRCAGCTVAATVAIGNADVGSGAMPTKLTTALLQHPKVNALNVPIDGWMFAGLAQSLSASGRSGSVTVVGGIGSAGNYDLIRGNKGEDASATFSGPWDGWSGVDAAVRVLAGAPAVPSGVGIQVVDASMNLPATGVPFSGTPAVDFASAYKKAWGVS